MEQFKYKTHGNSTPQGKPRIYFCSHPEDTALFLDDISKDILEKQNCAIWYRDSRSDVYDEETISLLSQMQLFVIPITMKFLTTSNRALDVEFSYAVQNHIPVLPLMQEAGLEELFNQKCGNLQFLDKSAQDITAISYSEKLDKFLSDIVVGDSLAEQVRAAFDAYIFLSYRKKDRAYAQKLMELIHENDFCRDIAIWYDEFLTPGENFNDSIKDALQKSQLFALVVTPNLINEENYVQDIEYPMAKNADKRILAAELSKTDPEKLHAKFANLPSCTDAYNSNELSEDLMRLLQTIAIQENNWDPQHNFFIGLAYLAGIDVEINFTRAFSLIEGAADAGLPQAMEKLITMYKNGEGVERNPEAAVGWQQKLSALYLEQYEVNGDLKNAHAYIDTLLSQRETLNEIQSTKEAMEVCQQAYAFCRALCTKNHDFANNKYLITCCLQLGNDYKKEGHLIQAGALFEEAYGLCQTLSSETDNETLSQYSLLCLDRIASYYKVANDLGKALDYSSQSLSLAQELADKTNSISDRKQLADCYINLGNVYMAAEDLTNAKSNYQAALELTQQLCAENPEPKAFYSFVVCCRHLSSACRALDEIDEAKEYYLQALEMSDQLIDQSGYLISFQDLADCHNDLGDIYRDCADLSKAEWHYRQAHNIILHLGEKIDTPRLRKAYRENAKRFSELLQDIPDPAITIQAGLLAKEYIENKKEAIAEEERSFLEKTIQAGVEAEPLLYKLRMYMISTILSAYSSNGVPFSKLLQIGYQALISGAGKYGRSTGNDFVNHISHYLRQKIVQEIANQEREVRISVREIDGIKKLKAVFSAFKMEMNRDPMPEELAEKMNISLSELKELVHVMHVLEVHNQEVEKEKQKKEEEMGHLNTKQLLLQNEQARLLLTSGLSKLSSREADILRLRYGVEGEAVHSTQEVAQILNLPESRIRQIESKALRKLKI